MHDFMERNENVPDYDELRMSAQLPNVEWERSRGIHYSGMDDRGGAIYKMGRKVVHLRFPSETEEGYEVIFYAGKGIGHREGATTIGTYTRTDEIIAAALEKIFLGTERRKN